MFKLFFFQPQNAMKIGNKTAINHLHGEITRYSKERVMFFKTKILYKDKK